MTNWLEQASVSLDKAMHEYRHNTYLHQVTGNEDKRVRYACRVAYEEGLRNAERMRKEEKA
jgi:hypothetical protein